MKRALLALSITVLLFGCLAMSVPAATGTRADIADAKRLDNVSSFNLGAYPVEYREANSERPMRREGLGQSGRQSIGSSMSPNAGIGRGVSVDITFNDVQWTWGIGRQIDTWYNGLTGENAEVSVHFGYQRQKDTIPGWPYGKTGYNVYDATVASGNWPRLQDVGCALEGTDTIGNNWLTSLDLMDNGFVVIATVAEFKRTLVDGTRLNDNVIYFQDGEFSCSYDPLEGAFIGATTWIDSTVYRPNGLNHDEGNMARDPQIATQWDGDNTVVHLVMGESEGTPVAGDAFADNEDHRVYTYYRKVGNTADAGLPWTTGQILDTIWFVWGSLAAARFPDQGVAYSYTNATYYGGLMDLESEDNDLWVRESYDRGQSWWEPAYSPTNYTNAILGHPNHNKCWLESFSMFDSQGDLHIIYGATPTSSNPYFDGFNWNDFNNNMMHWEKDDAVDCPDNYLHCGLHAKVANGNFMNAGNLDGSMNTLHCGFGGSNALYLSFGQMAECDEKLYIVWSQIHERANRYSWRDSEEVPAPGVLDDCSVVGERLAMANWEILMSVSRLSGSNLWDYPRSVSDTYTPDCGIDGYEGHEEMLGPCGSEWKPSIEHFGHDDFGLSLTWPAASIVDLTPLGDPAGTHDGFYLNMHYLDDQFPGPYIWGRTNPPGTENSEKWIRLACVDPVEAAQIRIEPFSIVWPEWVVLDQSNTMTVTVFNEGNINLDVTDVTADDGGGNWLSDNATTPFTVTAGQSNTATFDIFIDATGLTTVQWLEGTLTLVSNADNFPTIDVDIRVLAAYHVEPVVWDTVLTDGNMFSEYFLPTGECVALGVGNNGDLGWGFGSSGAINMDYVESDLECGERDRDGYYLIGASAFTIMADDGNGTNAELTQVFNDPHQADERGFDPLLVVAKGSITGGEGTRLGADTDDGLDYDFDSVYTGVFVNQDTTIAMERIVYGPRFDDLIGPPIKHINFVIVHTMMYSADEASHSNVTLGNVVDWDIPAEDIPTNTSGLSTSGAGFVYMQGSDTTGALSCQSHTGRFATEALGGAYTHAGFLTGGCDSVTSGDPFSVNVLLQTIMTDTTHDRAGGVYTPNQPHPLEWWDETGAAGKNAVADPTPEDFAIWMTYVHNYNLGALDTLHFWSVLSTTLDGTLADLEAQVKFAKKWYANLSGCPLITGCCQGEQVGDANAQGGDTPTIGDVSVMIDAKFIAGVCTKYPGTPEEVKVIACLQEADINQSGGADPDCQDITIGDISILIDFLFISGPFHETLNPSGVKLKSCL